MPIIRSDSLALHVTSADQQTALADTLALYRRLVRDLMTVAYTHWPQVGVCEGNAVVEVIERLIHPTQ
ncbi:transposase, partial [Vreelandella rituensis]